MMMMATILMISLAAALPSVYVEGQREKEEELIFRGQQYARAIQLFHTQFNRYPSSVKELLHTNELSFLRRAYRDPMSKSGQWRFIHATANGIIIDSKILKPPTPQNGPSSGVNSGAANADNSKAEGTVGGTSSGQSEEGNGATSSQNSQGFGNFTAFGGQNSGPTSGQSGQPNVGSSIFGGNNTMLGAFIVGVASSSKKQSIRVYEDHTEYDLWEFLGVPGAPGAPVSPQVGGIPASQGNSNQQSPTLLPQASPMMGGGSNPQ